MTVVVGLMFSQTCQQMETNFDILYYCVCVSVNRMSSVAFLCAFV